MTRKPMKRTTRKPMGRAAKKAFTAKDFLFTLDAFFAEPADRVPSNEKRKVWNILTALRGPDNGNDAVKEETTCVIRAKVFPKGRSSISNYAIVAPSWQEKIDFSTLPASAVEAHFRAHIARAARDLGIPVEGLKFDEYDY